MLVDPARVSVTFPLAEGVTVQTNEEEPLTLAPEIIALMLATTRFEHSCAAVNDGNWRLDVTTS
jgi:hypothetical protein